MVCPEGNQLAYLDFGILSDVPPQVRDGLVCAVSYLVFARDVQAVASLFGELQLLPADVMEDPNELRLYVPLTVTKMSFPPTRCKTRMS